MNIAKKGLVVFLSVSLLFLSLTSPVLAFSPDINGDGRIDSRDLSQLITNFTNIFDYNLTAGNFGTSVAITPTPPPVCLTTVGGGSWANLGVTEQSGIFAVEFEAKTSQINRDHAMYVGLSDNPITASPPNTGIPKLATAVQFDIDGTIHARNAEVWVTDSAILYSQNETYHFRLEIDIFAQTYTIYVTAPGGNRQTVGLNYKFRKEKGVPAVFVPRLNNVGVLVNSTTGTFQVCNVVL